MIADVHQVCDTEAISTVQRMINEVINEDVVWAKSPLELRNQRCHAVKVRVICLSGSLQYYIHISERYEE